MWLLRSRTNPRRSKKPKRRQKRSWVSEEVGRRSRCRLTGPKSTHHLKSHKDQRSWTRALHAFSHLFIRGLHTYVLRQFRPNLSPGWPRTRFGRDRPLTVIWLGRSCHFTNKALPLTKRIGNIVVFPALCKPRYAGISQNSSKTPLSKSQCLLLQVEFFFQFRRAILVFKLSYTPPGYTYKIKV